MLKMVRRKGIEVRGDEVKRFEVMRKLREESWKAVRRGEDKRTE
jgi:hypothetical protein